MLIVLLLDFIFYMCSFIRVNGLLYLIFFVSVLYMFLFNSWWDVVKMYVEPLVKFIVHNIEQPDIF